MRHLIRALWRLLTPAERRSSLWLGLLMLATGAIEVSGLISVVPLVAVLTSSVDPCARLGQTAGRLCAQALPSRDPYVLGGLAFVLIATSNLLAFAVAWLSARLAFAVWRRVATNLFNNYIERPYEYFFRVHSSEVVKNVALETERFAHLVFMPMLVLVSRAVITAAVIALVLVVDASVSIVVVAFMGGLYAFVYRRLQGRMRRSGQLALAARTRISNITTETIGGIREVRMLACESYFADKFARSSSTLAREYLYGVVVSVLPRYIIETTAFVLMLGLAVYLHRALGDWQAAAPLLAFYVFTAYRLLPQFQQIYANAMAIQQNAVVVDTLGELLLAPPLVHATEQLPSSAQGEKDLRPPIRVRDVTYRYAGVDRPVLSSANMEIPARATVGLVGATGAGKSTIIDLIAGLLYPTQGTVEVNGMPLDDRLAISWRRRIGYVPQVLFLLDDSIRRNIAFGLDDPAISQQEVERAARAANIHDFIASLPEGYDTLVGERGVRFSGGQRQRLVIARALYRDPEVLIFDEATSALDQETEQAVMDAIGTLSHQKTLFIISHRPATLQGCDLVYEVADGKINLHKPGALRSSA